MLSKGTAIVLIVCVCNSWDLFYYGFCYAGFKFFK